MKIPTDPDNRFMVTESRQEILIEGLQALILHHEDAAPENLIVMLGEAWKLPCNECAWLGFTLGVFLALEANNDDNDNKT